MLDGPGRWRARRLAPLLLGLIMLFDSWDSVTIAFIMPSLDRQWNLEPLGMGLLMSSGYAGQLLGAVAVGSLADRFGRKPSYGAAVCAMALLSLACAAARTPEQMGILRFLQGLAIGGALPVCASYINEIAATPTRGRFFSIFQFLMVSGYAAAAISSSLLIERFGWQVMLILGAAPLLILPWALLLLPESPRWLCRSGRFEDAVAAVRRLGGSAVPPGGAGEAAPAVAETRLGDLFAADVRGRVAILVGLWFVTSLVNFGLTNWVPSIYVKMFHIPLGEALRFSAIAVVLTLLAPILLGALMDRIGRRPLAILGTGIGGLVLLGLPLASHGKIGAVVGLIAFGHTAIGIGTIILWPYSAEAFPTRIRARALGLCSAAARTASMLTPLLVGGMIAATGAVGPVFVLFGALGIAAATIWLTATTETSGTAVDAAEG